MKISFNISFKRFYGARRGPLSRKSGNKQYYRGMGGGSMGKIDPYGQFHPDPDKVRSWMIPELGDFPLRPYVSKKTLPFAGAVKDVKGYMEAAMANDDDINVIKE